MIPKELTSKFVPGLGDQHEVGLTNVGICAVSATLTLNTVQTDAQIIAAPPNVTGVPSGAIVHSLGTAPTIAFTQLNSNPAQFNYGVGVQYITANASAMFFRAFQWTGVLPGISVRAIAIR